jgi:hypothetical protein
LRSWFGLLAAAGKRDLPAGFNEVFRKIGSEAGVADAADLMDVYFLSVAMASVVIRTHRYALGSKKFDNGEPPG